MQAAAVPAVVSPLAFSPLLSVVGGLRPGAPLQAAQPLQAATAQLQAAQLQAVQLQAAQAMQMQAAAAAAAAAPVPTPMPPVVAPSPSMHHYGFGVPHGALHGAPPHRPAPMGVQPPGWLAPAAAGGLPMPMHEDDGVGI